MAAGSRYGISLKQLRELMEFRGREGVEKIKEYGGVHEIANKLQSSEKSGKEVLRLCHQSYKALDDLN